MKLDSQYVTTDVDYIYITSANSNRSRLIMEGTAMNQDHIASLKAQEKKYREVVNDDLISIKETTTDILGDISLSTPANHRQLAIIDKLEDELNQLLLLEENLKTELQKVETKAETGNKIAALEDASKLIQLELINYNKVFQMYIEKLKVIIKLENVEGNLHTIEVHFPNKEKMRVKLVINIENKTIVSACLDNLEECPEKEELVRYLQYHRECPPFLIKLRNCVNAQSD